MIFAIVEFLGGRKTELPGEKQESQKKNSNARRKTRNTGAKQKLCVKIMDQDENQPVMC